MNVPERLVVLAPQHLAVHRVSRYDGTGFEVTLDRFTRDDRYLLRSIYDTVRELLSLWRQMHIHPNFPALDRFIRQMGNGRLQIAAQMLGAGPRAVGYEPAVRKAVHDIRAGALSVLLGTVELLRQSPGNTKLMRECVDAARDHAKIMRNLLPDLDPALREADEAPRPHTVDHFVTKWDGLATRASAEVVETRVRCTYHGNIAARCLETSSIDRVLYNYMNNAMRFASDRTVTLWIFPINQDLTRWVVHNQLTADQAERLSGAIDSQPWRLFNGEVRRGPDGLGLSNCAEIVAGCFGLPTPQEAVDQQYLGAAILETDYLAWFHWPKYTQPAAPADRSTSA